MRWFCILVILFFAGTVKVEKVKSFMVIIISQSAEYDRKYVQSLKESLTNQSLNINLTMNIYTTDTDFNEVIGSWAIWPLFKTLRNRPEANWLLFCEAHIHVNLELLVNFLANYSSDGKYFIGRALRDASPTIIHHFYHHDSKEQDFTFPDFAAGFVISKGLYDIINISVERFSEFSIDAMHELARLFFDSVGITLLNSNRFCLLNNETDCVTRYIKPNYADCDKNVTNRDVFFAIKTFSDYHKTRITVVKRTWARTAKYVEYFSDQQDHYIPTIVLGINNTKRGHCAKTLSILKHFLSHNEAKYMSWFVIADDDTLISVRRLYRLLSCYDARLKLIVGERYGYGFSGVGLYGYDYPTGGASMIFTQGAMQKMAKSCSCPNVDSPDDMIIGMCARRFFIPIIHSTAFHQARSVDYPRLYLEKIPPISFHKFEDIDPYEEYATWLHDTDSIPASRPLHSEL